ncbi:hypothetical protein, partial [Oenococcus oeni]
ELYLDYMTGFLGTIVFLIVYFWIQRNKLRKTNFLLNCCVTCIPFFSLLSVFLATKFNPATDLWNKLNDLLSLRLPIWDYYYRGWPPTLFGNSIDVNGQTQGVVGYGAFDGAYIYFLLKYGVFSLFILFIAVLALKRVKNKAYEKTILSVMLFVILLTCFPETSGFIVAYTPIFSLMGSFLFYNEKSNLIKKYQMFKASENDE